MASFVILDMSVRSVTPTSFFFWVSKTAFLTFDCPPEEPEGSASLPLAFRPARFVTAYTKELVSTQVASPEHGKDG